MLLDFATLWYFATILETSDQTSGFKKLLRGSDQLVPAFTEY
jgi:hypothetical protein